MKEKPLMYEFDDSAAAIGVFFLAMLLWLMLYVATPAHSQEPTRPACAPAADMHEQLQKRYGETVTAGGIVGPEFMEITTNELTGSFTILMRRIDGTACLVLGGQGFALADPAHMKGSGL